MRRYSIAAAALVIGLTAYAGTIGIVKDSTTGICAQQVYFNNAAIAAMQYQDDLLDDIAAMTPSDGGFVVGDGSGLVLETGSTARDSMGLGTAATPQFTRLGIGIAADGTIELVIAGATPTIKLDATSGADCSMVWSGTETALTFGGALVPGDTSAAVAGAVRYHGGDVEAYVSGAWTSLTAGGGSYLPLTGGTVTGLIAMESPLAASFGKDDATNTAGRVRLWSAGATDYWLDIIAPTLTQNVLLTMPTDDGAAGQVLTTDGDGVLSWATPAGAGDMLKATYDTDDNGVVDYVQNEADTIASVSARGETFAADAILPVGGSLKFAGSVGVKAYDADSLRIEDGAGNGKILRTYQTVVENSVELGTRQHIGTLSGLEGGSLGYFNTTGYLNFNDATVGYWSHEQVYAYGDHYSTTDTDNFAAGLRIDPWDRVSGVSTMRTGIYLYSDGTKACITLPTMESNLVLDTGYTVTVGGVNALYSVDTEYLNAGAWVPNTTNGPTAGTLESTTNLVMDDGYWFDPDTNQTAQAKVQFPLNWDCGPIRVKIETYSASASESDVVWEFSGLARRDGSTWDSAHGETVQVTDTHQGAGKMSVSAASGYMTFAGTPQPGDVCTIYITRNAATAGDTFNESSLATGLTIQFGESPIASHVWP